MSYPLARVVPLAKRGPARIPWRNSWGVTSDKKGYRICLPRLRPQITGVDARTGATSSIVTNILTKC